MEESKKKRNRIKQRYESVRNVEEVWWEWPMKIWVWMA
jgi:hypothetical protein